MFKRSFKDAKMTTDHEIGHIVNNQNANVLNKDGAPKYVEWWNKNDNSPDTVLMRKKTAAARKFIDTANKYDRSDEVEHANVGEGFADRYSANKNGQKNVRHFLKRGYKENKKERDKRSTEYNKASQIDQDVRRKMLNDPELANHKLDDEKRDYGKGIKKRFDAQNVSKKHRNMNQEAQEKKKKKFNKE